MDFLAKRGRFCRHNLPYVEKSNDLQQKRRIKILKDKIKTISKTPKLQNSDKTLFVTFCVFFDTMISRHIFPASTAGSPY